jgi:putative ATP-dependent endonuclease of the OLD family
MRISRIQISNFRNFHRLDIAVSAHAVIVGENKIGKSNLLYALRLVLDPTLPDSARQLKEEDFWDGLPRPLTKSDFIKISVDFTDFENEDRLLAVLGEFLIAPNPMVSRLTYVFGPIGIEDENGDDNDNADADEESPKESDYDFFIYGADKSESRIGSEYRRRLPLDLLPALRDAEGDLANWRRSPLRPLLDEVASRIDRDTLSEVAENISEATETLTETDEVSALGDEITGRMTAMVGSAQALEMTLGFSPTEADRLIRSLRLFIDDGKRGVAEASLGSANLLYLALKGLELEQLVKKGKRDHTFLAIEEPEAHLHPHLQRLVYRDFLKRRTHQEGAKSKEAAEHSTSVLMTTHSPHIVSVSPIKSIVLLRKASDEESSIGISAAEIKLEEKEREDLERYIDVTRGEMMFAKGVLLVEGEAETYVVPALGKLMGHDFDELGISVCSVAGTNFEPYVKLLGPGGLDIPFAVLTDFDPMEGGKNLGEKRIVSLLEHLVPEKTRAGKERSELVGIAKAHGLFLNEYTFEVDLFRSGRHKSICGTLAELAVSQPAKERAQKWKDNPGKCEPLELLADIDKIGKGRFAQRLAGNLSGKPCPDYIEKAIKHVVSRCR